MSAQQTVGFFGKLYCKFYLFKIPRVWGILWLKFFKMAYPGFSIGKRPRVYGAFSIHLMNGGRVEIGDDFHLVSEPRRAATTLFGRAQLTAFPDATIKLGNHVGLNGTAITAKKRVEIGDHTMIAQNVIIVDTDFHSKSPENRWGNVTTDLDKEVIIGKNVWIGMNSIILKGSRIGDNSILGAGSVLAGEIPANCIAAGNPARVIKDL